MQYRLHVPLQSNRIHENERQPRFRQRGLIAARRLALAIVQIEQFQIVHLLEAPRQFPVERIKNLLRARDHFADLRERFQRRTVQRVNRQVPGTQFLQIQLPAPPRLEFAKEGYNVPFNGVVKLRAIIRRVIETA